MWVVESIGGRMSSTVDVKSNKIEVNVSEVPIGNPVEVKGFVELTAPIDADVGIDVYVNDRIINTITTTAQKGKGEYALQLKFNEPGVYLLKTFARVLRVRGHPCALEVSVDGTIDSELFVDTTGMYLMLDEKCAKEIGSGCTWLTTTVPISIRCVKGEERHCFRVVVEGNGVPLVTKEMCLGKGEKGLVDVRADELKGVKELSVKIVPEDPLVVPPPPLEYRVIDTSEFKVIGVFGKTMTLQVPDLPDPEHYYKITFYNNVAGVVKEVIPKAKIVNVSFYEGACINQISLKLCGKNYRTECPFPLVNINAVKPYCF